MKTHTYRVERETSPEPCGYDYESFINGTYCTDDVEYVVIEDKDFHFAHLCGQHTSDVLALLDGIQ